MYRRIIGTVINAEESITQSIAQKQEELLWLLSAQACKRCIHFIESHGRYLSNDPQEKLHLGGRLLLILAAMQNVTKAVQREQLTLLGVRKFAHECKRIARVKMAAMAREKPLRSRRYYVAEHLPRVERRMAGQLEALVEHPEVLEAALARDGMTAILNYL
jgi:hypothetical protein